MIVVDTSAWIDYFAGRSDLAHVATLRALIGRDAHIGLTDVILTEVLQGLRDDETVRRVDDRLSVLDVARLERLDDFRRAAALYRAARRRGLTIRSTVDCLIASVCIGGSHEILHNDRDFDHLARISDLRVHPVA